MEPGSTLDAISRALPGLYSMLEDLDELRRQRAEDFLVLEEHFPDALQNMYQAVTTLLEAAKLPRARTDFVREWERATKKGVGYFKEEEYSPGQSYSPALVTLHRAMSRLKALAGGGVPPIEEYNLKRFEQLLRRTAELIHRRQVQPANEMDVQQVMNDYLFAAFVDYISPAHVSGIVKSFQPDGGVRSLKAVVEFKFASSRQEVKTALSGILEDTAGYRGSLDWTRFYSVVYMTGPFESEPRFAADFVRVGAVTWTPILVNGASVAAPKPGRRRQRS